MKIIRLDASGWTNVMDFYNALRSALGSPEWHSASIDAMLDSMIWGGINAVEPPYKVVISGTANLPNDVRDEIELLTKCLAEHRIEHQTRKGKDVEVTLAMVP
jgi:RNAse (barnase) inhibitor barstar